MKNQWEALVRALRTFGQGLIATALVAAYDAVSAALAAGDVALVEWGKLASIAGTAALAAVISYVHNVIAPRKLQEPEKRGMHAL